MKVKMSINKKKNTLLSLIVLLISVNGHVSSSNTFSCSFSGTLVEDPSDRAAASSNNEYADSSIALLTDTQHQELEAAKAELRTRQQDLERLFQTPPFELEDSPLTKEEVDKRLRAVLESQRETPSCPFLEEQPLLPGVVPERENNSDLLVSHFEGGCPPDAAPTSQNSVTFFGAIQYDGPKIPRSQSLPNSISGQQNATQPPLNTATGKEIQKCQMRYFDTKDSVKDTLYNLPDGQGALFLSYFPGDDKLEERTAKVLRRLFLKSPFSGITIAETVGTYEEKNEGSVIMFGDIETLKKAWQYTAQTFEQDCAILYKADFNSPVLAKVLDGSGNTIEEFKRIKISLDPINGDCTCVSTKEGKVYIKFYNASDTLMPRSKSFILIPKDNNEDLNSIHLLERSISRPVSPSPAFIASSLNQ